MLRQDPDVILVGEMRDLETISTALTAAETGHLVFATLHTQDAPQSIDRIIDVFPAHQQQQVRVQLASLQGICTQQLLPTPDGRGRVAACEVLVATPAIRNLIREAKTHQIYSMLQAGGKFGMVTMDMSLAKLATTHKISLDVARILRQRRRPAPTHGGPDVAETFAYKVRDRGGKLLEGTLEADSQQLLIGKLRSMGYMPIDIQQQETPPMSRELKMPFFSTRVKLKDVAVMSRQFATMINSGSRCCARSTSSPSRPRASRSPRSSTRCASTSRRVRHSRPRCRVTRRRSAGSTSPW